MPDRHAKLSPSSAERWMNCPGSVKLTADMPDTVSEYAEAGRLAHSIGELKLRKRFLTGVGKKTYDKKMAEYAALPLYAPEMLHTTDEYLEYIEELYTGRPAKPYMVVEKEVDLSDFIPEAFGTADCILIGGGVMDVVDYKHGQGVPVAAEDNAQMKCYALGALMAYRLFYDIGTVNLHIVQPRNGGTQSWSLTRDELIDWGVQVLRPAAKEAFEGSDRFQEGEHCRFCKAKATCKARSDVFTALEDFGEKAPELLSNEEIGGILEIGQRLKKWVSDLEEYSLAAVLRGEEIPGWKVVAGRSVRSFVDTEAAFESLKEAGVETELLYERKPLSLAQLEKMLGKKKFGELVGDHIVTPMGKPTLVVQSDKRPPYSTAEEDFKNG
ncbi:DUF2800 domain-containing protein [Ruminococcaceae bacterium OttesenSCG-928-I18]|nr:DUF2800 domain-containing protein [Ruminococcaceae bacterium OttesenSCG-928-I18]